MLSYILIINSKYKILISRKGMNQSLGYVDQQISSLILIKN